MAITITITTGTIVTVAGHREWIFVTGDDWPKTQEYPHDCPRCGRAAYCGLFEVTHRDEFAAVDCPARRA